MHGLRAGVALLWLAAGAVVEAAETRSILLEDGQKVSFEAGEIRVPESRAGRSSRTLTIPYYRLKSTADEPSAPVFLLAGGPGDSWIDRFETRDGRDEALLYRQVADVVLFDQRGAGHASPRLECPEPLGLPLDAVVTDESYATALRRASSKCRAHWLREGVDLAAYNTLENAADVDQLRRFLGYPQISLIGGSYGSHLALALMRRHPGIVARAVLFGVEGPDQTYDMPSQILRGFEQLAAAAQLDPVFRDRFPPGGALEALRRVEQRLHAKPEVVEVQRDGRPVRVTVGRFDVQRSIPSGALNLDNLAWARRVLEMYEGDLARVAGDAIDTREQRLDAMYFMMDCASGISRERRRRIENSAGERAAQDLLGRINGEYTAACDAWGHPDLGPAFRSDLVSTVPTLIFAGTWDIATPLLNAEEVVRGLRRGHLAIVEGGTHLVLKDLFKRWPPMRELMSRFLAGGDVSPPRRIVLPEAKFLPPVSAPPFP